MKSFIYDVEIFPNFFSVIFIDVDTKKEYIEAYEKADIRKDSKTKKFILDNLIKPYVFIIHESRNDLSLLLDFMSYHKTLVGYNSINYDDNVLNYLLINAGRFNKKGVNKFGNHITKELYRLSQDLINYGTGWIWAQDKETKYFKKPYDTIDMQKLLYLDKSFISLKQVSIQLKHYRIQDLPLPYYENIDLKQVDEIIDYNINDVIITYKLYHLKHDEVVLRDAISNTYGVNVKTESRSGVANKLMMNFYLAESGLTYNDLKDLTTLRRVIKFDELITNNVSFYNREFKEFLDKLRNKKIIVGNETLKESIIFQGKEYTFATGGLHSVDRPNIFKSDESHIIRDCDASSFYPYIILNNRICPEHLNADIFLTILERITIERIEAKDNTKKLSKSGAISDNVKRYIAIFKHKTEALKLTINKIYGGLGDEHSFWYDLKAMYRTTINGQLYLLMLIDRLHNIGVKCVSANTDGIICRIPVEKEGMYYDVCKQWEKDTNFTLEYTDYEKYVCYAVNDYMAIKTGYSKTNKSDEDKANYIKEKGLFNTSIQIEKGYNHPVVAKALLHYYADGIMPEDYIKNHKDIYDFCVSVKTGAEFIKEYQTLKDGQLHIQELQKNVRYYISTVSGVIMKKYIEPKIDKKGTRREYISLQSGVNTTIFNDYIEYDDFADYKINYNYYIAQAYKVLHEISNIVRLKMKNRSYGGLFKNTEDE